MSVSIWRARIRSWLGSRWVSSRPGQAVVASVRPEKIRIFDNATLKFGVPANQPNIFPIRILQTTYIGSDTRVVVDFGAGVQLKVWEQNHLSTLDALAYYTPGQELWVTIRPRIS